MNFSDQIKERKELQMRLAILANKEKERLKRSGFIDK